ncbi:hypothetical protein VYU27_004594 [Nannochloropsis oceanica]
MSLPPRAPVIHEDHASSTIPATIDPTPQHQHQQQEEEDDWAISGGQSWGVQSSFSFNEDESPDCTRHSEHQGVNDSPTPSSQCGGVPSMGRKRMSFTRIDNIPQVRIDVKHLSYSVKNSTVTQSWSFPFLPADLRRRWLAFRAQPPSPVPPQSPSSPSTAEAAEAEVPLKATGRHNSTTNLPAAAAALPPPPLSYDLQVDSSTAPALLTPILRDISLSFTPGSLTGLMGPSGSGKTSLLQVLHGAAKHTRGGILEGSVLINGTPCRNINRAFRQMCSLVPQEDILLPELSVHETLTFAAELRLPQSDTREEREETVESVMTELGLGDCRNVRIGSVEKVGISGGQRRRVSIGLELLTDPSILLLDEPTSGLDSKTAEDICRLLQFLAGPDRCVITSIHQPSYQIFMSCFNRFVFMVSGQVAYDGPPSRLAGFFYGMGFEPPPFENPADFYLKVLNESPDAVLDAWRKVAIQREKDDLETALASTPCLALPQPLPNPSSTTASFSFHALTSLPSLSRPSSFRGALGKLGFRSSLSSPSLPSSFLPSMPGHQQSGGGGGEGGISLSRVNSCESLQLVVPGGEVLQIDRHASWLAKETSDILAQTSWPYQFSVLFRRMLTHTCKDRVKVVHRLGMEIFTGLVVGTVWFQQEVERQKSIFPILGLFSIITTIAVFNSFLTLVLTFPLTRAVHFREYHNGHYHLVPYFMASVGVACLQSSVFLIVDAGIVFGMAGLPFTVGKLGVYLGVCALGGCIGAALGFLVGCLTSDIQRMQQIVVPTLLPLLVFSGYMIPLARMPKYLKWLYWGSFYQYMYSSLVINHFSGLTFTDCPTRSTGSDVEGYTCKHHGEEVLAALALAPDQLVRNAGVLVGTLVVFLSLGYTALRYKSR